MVTITRKDRHNAVARVGYAISRGELIRPEKCSGCDRFKKTDGHHEDYSKPLEVIWLCRKCHQQKHGRIKGKQNKDRGTYRGIRLPSLDPCPFESDGLIAEIVIDEHEYWPETIDWEKLLDRLTYRGREIIRLRYGLNEDGFTYTLAEVARIFKVTKERVRQVEKKAIYQLREIMQPEYFS